MRHAIYLSSLASLLAGASAFSGLARGPRRTTLPMMSSSGQGTPPPQWRSPSAPAASLAGAESAQLAADNKAAAAEKRLAELETQVGLTTAAAAEAESKAKLDIATAARQRKADEMASSWASSSMAPVRRAAAMPDMKQSIHDASDLLSHQAIMENFVHHNPWESLQSMDFFDALKHVDERSAYKSPGERLSYLNALDPRVRANKAIAELGAPFLDRGLSKWEPPDREKGFLHFFAMNEALGLAPWREHARHAAQDIKRRFETDPYLDPEDLAASIVHNELATLEEDPALWEKTMRAMLLDLPGWAGMFKRMEEHKEEAPKICREGVCEYTVPVRLSEFMAVHLIMTRSSIEAQVRKLGTDLKEGDSKTLSAFLARIPRTRKGEREKLGMGSEMLSLRNPSGLSYRNQDLDMVGELEDDYARVTLKAFNLFNGDQPEVGSAKEPRPRPNFQFYTCFDEREESFRRLLEAEATTPIEVETHGVAGFFNMAIRYQSPNHRPEEILAPEGNCPPDAHLVSYEEQTAGYRSRKAFQAELSLAFEKATYSPVGSLALAGTMLPYSMAKLLLRSFSPEATMEIEDGINKNLAGLSKTDFVMPYTTDEATARLAQLFKNVGEMTNFARLVVCTGHGSRSVNNPFLAAYNCGACCGREGGPNARVFARCANDPAVRKQLAEQHGIVIPDDTWFVGGYHDTTSDLVDLYDTDRIPSSHQNDFERAQQIIDNARAKNALERCQKFFLSGATTPEAALRHVEARSRDVAEVRPELGHSTNAAIVVGRRALSKGRFLDRRIFLPTYDPFNDDDEGTNLQTVLTPALVVGSGISLEYFFSTVDGGAGTKVPVNVVGNFGIQQGTAGDLLIGLATQMSELHSPQRALYLIDAPVARVEAVLARAPNLMQIVRNNWVLFYVRDPATQQIFKQEGGEYTPVDDTDIYTSEATSHDLSTRGLTHIPFDEHAEHARSVTKEEDALTVVAGAVMLGSFAVPVLVLNDVLGSASGFVDTITSVGSVDDLVSSVSSAASSTELFAGLSNHPFLISLGATLLGISNLAYSRRYLHGEYMYGRMTGCSALMVLGFNLVAWTEGLDEALLGWTFIGLASTFLIGGFNDRPTARDNAAYAFGLYQLSDAALLAAAAFSSTNPEIADSLPPNAGAIAAVGLILSASIKSSQFPFHGLFLRSMEGASPNSALGYAGLSAHAGVVLLAGTNPIWFDYEWARLLLASIGGITLLQQAAIANVRADRKGGVASATSGTLGALFVLLACGYSDAALILSLGHAAFRMNQVVRSPGVITDAHNWEAALGPDKIAPEQVNPALWKAGWALNRFNSDFARLPDQFAQVDLKSKPIFYNAKTSQALCVALVVGLTGFLHLPPVEEHIADLMRTDPLVAAAILSGAAVTSTALIRFLFGNLLDFGRFRPY